MIRTIPLTIASLKGFFRNWRSVVLLIIVPIMLISVIFISFNPLGMQKTPVGIVSNGSINSADVKAVFSSYLLITEFSDLEDCMSNLRNLNQYACLEIISGQPIQLNINFDNTRTPIIWEIVARIKASVNQIKTARSKEIAAGFLDDSMDTMTRVESFRTQLNATISEIDVYIAEIDVTIGNLRQAKTDLAQATNDMDSDILYAKSLSKDAQQTLDSLYSVSMDRLVYARAGLQSISTAATSPDIASVAASTQSTLDDLEQQINSRHIRTKNSLQSLDQRILAYEDASRQAKTYEQQIALYISELEDTRQSLQEYKQDIQNTAEEILSIENQYRKVLELDPGFLANPLQINEIAVFVPQISEEDLLKVEDLSAQEQATTGFNLTNLQTSYPTLLLLIAIFLCLLISSFICINEINSSAQSRIRLVKGIFIHEFLSVFLSSAILTFIPVLGVLILGDLLFRISILDNIGTVLMIMSLVCSIFIIIGIGIAYFIRKESTTLLISTFALVFIMFYSGFLMPIERMTSVAASMARMLPGDIALSAFNKVVFYGSASYGIAQELFMLTAWLTVLMLVCLMIKKIRD